MNKAAAQIRRLADKERSRGPWLSRYTRGYIHGLERALSEISYYHHAEQAAQAEAAIAAEETGGNDEPQTT